MGNTRNLKRLSPAPPLRTVAWLLAAAAVVLACPASGQRTMDLGQPSLWTACPGWVTNKPARSAVTRTPKGLTFEVEGAGSEMPWVRPLSDREIDGDSRFLLVRYRARGLSGAPGNYFLHGWDGTVGGRTYAGSAEPLGDGEWHVLAVDLAAGEPEEPTSQIALKVIPGPGGKATVAVGSIWFADSLPAGAQVVRSAPLPDEQRMMAWRALGALRPEPCWTTAPSAGCSARITPVGAEFTVPEPGKGMRWPHALPAPVDLTRAPWVSLRYRATGSISPAGYAIWLGDDATGARGHSVVALSSGELEADGRWHRVTVRLNAPFTATQIAVGLDCIGAPAALALSDLTFSSRPRRWSAQEILPHTPPSASTLAGFQPIASPVSGGRPGSSLWTRIGLDGWFAGSRIAVGGVPFTVPRDRAAVRQTGTGDMGSVTVRVPGRCRELYLLIAAAAPVRELFGLEANAPRKQELLCEPEKVLAEVRYASGPPDRMLPVDVGTGRFGVARGLGVCVVHPDPQRTPVSVTILDRMQTASFGVIAATAHTGRPRVREPGWQGLSAALRARPSSPAEALRAELEADATLRLAGVGEAAVANTPGPVFEVSIGGKPLPPSEWVAEPLRRAAATAECTLRHSATGLVAVVTCTQGTARGTVLRMTLRNEGTAPRTATLRFPVLRGLRFGTGETWYLSGKRGGIISAEDAQFRVALGEPHPLQMDGFFCPQTGAALALLTHDTAAQHHFVNLWKDASGGGWAPEYVERDLAPGASFTGTAAEIAPCGGGWRGIFAAYQAWLRTWFHAPPPKPWFQRTFAFISRNAHYASYPKPADRGAIQPAISLARQLLGYCDYVHLFGWSSSETYGDWGDYDHYDETVGGLASFRANIAAAQSGGVPVGLYQDGYLSSGKGAVAGSKAREWAMKRPDGSPDYVGAYDAYNECPYNDGWLDHLTKAYGRVVRDIGVRGMYVDEYGATDGRWACYAKDHGHNGYEVPYAGEMGMLRGLRAAVGPATALYSEYPPAEVGRTLLDGSFTYQALWSVDQERLAPHFVDLPRFAFPSFKQFHIIHYVPMRAGNWSLLKFPFFNGESYDLGEPNLTAADAEALAFLRRAMRVLCTHREAFSSPDVTPLVDSQADGVFANQFRTARQTIWTLYNANGRTVRGPVLRIRHVPGATYMDAWNGTRLRPVVRGGWAFISLELGPKSVGCVVQSR